MPRTKRKSYTASFRAEAVRLVLDEKMSQGQVSRDLDISESSLSRWVKQARIDAGAGRPSDLTTNERQELARLRRDNRRLRMERDILKNAAAFFAKETLS